MTQPTRSPRRAPRIGPFLVTGGVLGLLVGVVLSVVGSATAQYSAGRVLGFLGVGCAALGVLLAGIVFILLDRRS